MGTGLLVWSADGARPLRHVLAAATVLLCGFVLFLALTHSVNPYAEAGRHLALARQVVDGTIPAGAAPVYLVFLAAGLAALGPVWVFALNGPLLLLLLVLLAGLTAAAHRPAHDPVHGRSLEPGMAGLSALTIGLLFLHDDLLGWFAPGGDALALCLLLGAFLLAMQFARTHRIGWLQAAGLFLGVAGGARGVCLLFVAPIWYFLAHSEVRRRHALWGAVTPRLLVSVLLGLIPVLVYNLVNYGSPLLPPHVSDRWAAVTQGRLLPADLPIPGMSLHNVAVSAPAVMQAVLAHFTWVGILLAVAGLFAAMRRSYHAVYRLFFPAALVGALYYALRPPQDFGLYPLVGLFLTPIVATGITALAAVVMRGLGRLQRAPSRQRVLAAIPWGLALIGMSALVGAWAAQRNEVRLSLWDVPALQDALQARLDRDGRLLALSQEDQALGWFSNLPCRDCGAGRVMRMARQGGMDAALADLGRGYLDSLEREEALFVYEPSRWPVLRQWLEFEPVCSLSEFPVQPACGGRRITGSVYALKPWAEEDPTFLVGWPGDADRLLLVIDCFRLWDYPKRTFCRMTADDEVIEERVPNGVHFVLLEGPPPPDGVTRIQFLSDAALPRAPVVRAFGPDEPITLGFGTAADTGWCYALASGDRFPLSAFLPNGFALDDVGSLLLPKLGREGEHVYAEFRAVLQTRARSRRPCYVAGAQNAEDRASILFPGRESEATFTIDLGPCTNRFELAPLTVFFDGPEDDPFAAVRLESVTLRASPPPRSESILIDFGAPGDGLGLVEGFYPPESFAEHASGRRTADWATLRLPTDVPYRRLQVTLTVLDEGGAEPGERPSFLFNRYEIPARRVLRRQGVPGRVCYSFEVPPHVVRGEGQDVLHLMASPIAPFTSDWVDNPREAGLRIDSLSVEVVD